MKRLFILLVLVLAGCGKLASESATPSPTTPSANLETVGGLPYDDAMLMEGQINYSIFCQACHGPDATGLPSLGLDLTASQLLHKSTDEELLQFIIDGRAIDDPANTTGVAMPPRAGFPNLEDDQILTIIAYLRSISE